MLEHNAAFLLRQGYRLQWEPTQDSYVLLYPEGMVQLSETAAAILHCCDGMTPVSAMVEELAEEFDGKGMAKDVKDFLDAAHERGWIAQAEVEARPALAAR